MLEKFKIITDTNVVWLDTEPLDIILNSNLKDLSDFVNENKLNDKVTICISEVVMAERITQRAEEISKITSSIDSSIEKLKVFNVKKTSVHKRPYRRLLGQRLTKEIKALNLEVIPFPKVNHSQILNRALLRTKPFGNRDKGYKDTLIWHSILDEIRKDKDCNIILCTKNVEDFDIKVLELEFKKLSKKKLCIFTSPNEVKEFLDKQFNLSLDLKELHKSIINDIKTYALGDLMVNLNDDLIAQESGSNLFRAGYVEIPQVRWRIDGSDESREIVAYNFKKIDIRNISGDGPLYRIEADVEVSSRYKKPKEELFTFAQITRHNYEPNQLISVTFDYHIENKVITYQTSRKGIFLARYGYGFGI